MHALSDCIKEIRTYPNISTFNETETRRFVKVIKNARAKVSLIDKCVSIIQAKHALYLQNKNDIESVYIMGKNLNKIKPLFHVREWTGYVKGNLGVNIVIARRSMRIARTLTLDKAVEFKSISGAYLHCRELDRAAAKGRG